MNLSQSEGTKLVALPSGEHPWAQKLRRARKRVSRTQIALNLALTALVWGVFAEPWAKMIQTSIIEINPWIQALAYSAGLGLIYGVVDFPFSVITGYILEKRYGLSTQDLKSWFSDQLKGLLLGALLGSIIVVLVTSALLHLGENWWWATAIGAMLFGVLLTRLAPQIVLPLFFKLKPLDSPELQARFNAIAEKTATPVLGIYEIDLSRRTKAANAAVIGFGSTRRAVVGDTLLAEFTTDEAEFVLAHELGHHRYHDLWSGIAISSSITLVALAFTHLVLFHVAGTHGVAYPVNNSANFSPALLFWIAVVSSAIQTVLNPLSRLFSRYVETRADRFAERATGNPKAGASAFRKLGFQNLAVFQPPSWEEALFHTHPAIARRIQRLEIEDRA